jgi:hypothetical protein
MDFLGRVSAVGGAMNSPWLHVRHHGFPSDGELVLTKVNRDGRNSLVKFLTRQGDSWRREDGSKIGWHPTHWKP